MSNQTHVLCQGQAVASTGNFLFLQFIQFQIFKNLFEYSRHEFTPTTEEIEEVSVLFDKNLEIPQNFSQTASFFEPGEHPGKAYPIVPSIFDD